MIHGFELIKTQDIPELNTRARFFRHVKTGAELLSLENEDENKVFGITFRTPPTDSTGVAHIMEHSVLCGSKKYPLKEPFVELVKGSLKTFINAFTYPDKTCYPVASQNLQDFYNLIDVYMDAVFHPLLYPHTLQQEGWHYELDSLEAPLAYKGVVFNEMRGAYSDPDNLLAEYARQSIFPDNPYGVDSGGDPRVIPQLTYVQFKRFHENYYHPSNARIYFYGDDDPDTRLRMMNTYLESYAALQINSIIPVQPKLELSKRLVIPYDPGEEAGGKKAMFVVNWLLPDTSDTQTVLALQILSHILIETPASPLRKALIDSGLGEDIAGVGLDWQLRQMYFSTGLKGIQLEEETDLARADKVGDLIFQTLETLARQGIDSDTIAASMNTVEFQLRENNTGSFPRGLWLMLRSLTTWLYDGDPVAPLAFEAPLQAIKERLSANPRYFESLIQQHLLENQHFTTVILKPEPGLQQREDQNERERLAQIRATMSQEELQATLELTQRLKRIQETPDSPEALATIPSLKLTDLDKTIKHIPLEVLERQDSKVFYHNLFTNGILYLDLGLDLHGLPQEYLPYIPLFGRALLEMGTETQDFVKLSQRIGRSTGGIAPVTFNSLIRDTEQGTSWLFLRGKATVAQTEELFSILRDILLTVQLDNQERFRQILLEEKAQREATLVPNAHLVVNTRLRALYNEADWAEEQMNGVEYLFFLRKLTESVENNWSEVLSRLQQIWKTLLNRQGMLCNVTLDEANWKLVQPHLDAFLQEIPSSSFTRVEWKPQPAARFEGLIVPAQVNFVGKGGNLYHLGYQLDGSIDVISNYLRTTWLWERVRVRGGAYGGFCLFNHRSGVFTYISYRDPNLLDTLVNFDRAGEFLSSLDFLRLDEKELTKSIIGAIGVMDAYQLPDAKGFTSMTRYLVGDTDERRQLWREQIFDTRLEDFRLLGEVLRQVAVEGSVVVMGPQEALEAANAQLAKRLELRRVL